MSKRLLFTVSIILAVGFLLSLTLLSLYSKGSNKVTIKLTEEQIKQVKAGGGSQTNSSTHRRPAPNNSSSYQNIGSYGQRCRH